MRIRHFRALTIRASLSLSIIFSATGGFANQSLQLASRGLPEVTEQLNRKTFLRVKAFRLKSARVLWVNWDLLSEMGIAFPPQGLTPEFEEQILNEYAYLIPSDKDKPDEFLEKFKYFYSGKYGGDGMGYAKGDGRAAAAGLFQEKGTNPTPNVQTAEEDFSGMGFWEKLRAKYSVFHHSHGGVKTREAMGEAIWGERQHRELPFDANRVAFIIGTDKSIDIPPEPRAIMVRQNSVRPAHFIRNWQALTEDEDAENARVSDVVTKLIANLPLSASERKLPKGEQIRQGILTMADRIARNWGAQYVRSIFVNSTSPSNIEMSGRILDHGPTTSLDGYTKAIAADSFPNGDPGSIFKDMLGEFLEDLHYTLPGKVEPYLPTVRQLEKQIRLSYDNQIKQDFLWKAGVPPQLSEWLLKTKSGVAFADAIKQVAVAGNDKVVKVEARMVVPRNTGTYDLATVLTVLTNEDASDPISLDRLLSRDLPDEALRTKLINAYYAAFETLANRTKKEKISAEALATYMSRAVERRNHKTTDLIRSPVSEMHFYQKIAAAALMKKPLVVGQYVDELISESSAEMPGLPPYTVILGEAKSPGPASHVFRVFDAKTNEFKILMTVPIDNGQAMTMGKKVPVKKLIASKAGLVLSVKRDLALKSKSMTLAGNTLIAEFEDAPIERAEVSVSMASTTPKTSGLPKIGALCNRLLSWLWP